MGLIQRFRTKRDETRRRKATLVKQEIANQLIVNPLCSNNENVFAQVQPLINDMILVKPFGVGKNNGVLPMTRTPELAVLYHPNEMMGWTDFASSMFRVWLTEDELNIHVHFNGRRVSGYTILPPRSKVYTTGGEHYFQVNTENGIENISRDEVMTLMFSRSPQNLQKGVSPATAISAWAETEDLLAQYERAYIENGAIPASITFIRASSQAKFEETRRELESNLRGASNHGKTIYIWRAYDKDTGDSLDQVEVKTIQGNNSTLAIKELSDIINDHINKAYGVSNFILGDDSSAKYDNAELSDYQFIKRRVFPALTAFWNQFQFELDRITGGLGYAIQFELELPDLTERKKVRAEIAKLNAETLTSLLNSGAPAAATVRALGLGDDWLNVARGISISGLAGMYKENKNESKRLVHTSNKTTYKQHSHTDVSASTTDALPPMDEDELKIYNTLIAMAERIFANTPNIDAEGVIGEIERVLDRKAELGASEGAEKVADLLKDEAVAQEIKNTIENLQISGTLKDRIHTRTARLVNHYEQATQELMEDVLANSAGKSAGEIRKALREVMPTWQAERIARTETVYAFKSGRLDEDENIAKRHNLNLKLVWRARHDNKTCDVCAAMDGQVVDVGRAYRDELVIPAGTHMINMKPGETLDEDLSISWAPSEWNDEGKIPQPHPNCRCYFDEIVEES